MAIKMKDVNLRNLNDVFTLEREGLFEISDDEVTKFKEGYDIDIKVLVSNFQITMMIYMY